MDLFIRARVIFADGCTLDFQPQEKYFYQDEIRRLQHFAKQRKARLYLLIAAP